MSRGALIQRMAILCGGALLVVNAAFYFLSDAYFHSHTEMVPGVGNMPIFSDEQQTKIRIAFIAFSGTLALVGFIAGLAPRIVGHVIPVLFGLAELVGAVGAFRAHLPWVLGVTLLIAGVLMPLLAYASFMQRSRAAWAFLVAMLAVFAIVGLFGAPKVRALLEIGLWYALMLPGLFVVGTITLISQKRFYVEPDLVDAIASAPLGTHVASETVSSGASPKQREEAAFRQQLEDQARWEMGTGAALIIIGVLVTALTYAAAANGGTYVVCSGAILGGAARFAQGARRGK